MIFTQQSNLPIIFQVDEGILEDVNDYLLRNKLLFSNILVVSGKSKSYKYAKIVSKKNNWRNYTINGNTIDEVEQLKSYVNNYNIDLLIGVGGGKVIDTVKRASYLSNTNNLSVPTVISNDGLISPVAVIENNTGKTDSLPGMMPMGVVIDLDIIKDSPKHFVTAAIGDVFSNLSATNDWILALKKDRENMNDIAFHMARSAANSLLYFNNIEVIDKAFLRILVQGLVNSGIAMSLAGTSRPCSGSEHLISHAIDYLNLSNNSLHGTQVASISLFSLFLQNKLLSFHVEFIKQLGIPIFFTDLLERWDENLFINLIKQARKMRGDRYTILHVYSDKQVFNEYLKYIELYK